MDSSSLAVAGVDGEVTVLRDEWGIPHVRAATSRDAFFGQGFVQAEDRLGQLEYDRRRAAGRWAEVVGPSALDQDVFARRADLPGVARREYDALDGASRAVLDSYAAGVNAYLTLGRPLPTDLELAGVTPDPWAPWECCAVFLVRHVAFASWQRKLWRGRLTAALDVDTAARVERRDPEDVPLIVPPGAVAIPATMGPDAIGDVAAAMAALAEESAGSNSWALAGSRTRSGAPLVAGDPHRLVEVPNVYYQCHLAAPEFDAIGLAFVGVPGMPHFGHNASVAWCVTNANGDYQDLYVERLAADNDRRVEVIEVRGAGPVRVECRATRHGPVLFGDPDSGVAVALRATALARPSAGLSVLAPMLAAGSVVELDGVMRRWVDPVNNVLSADRAGHLHYRTVGEIPVRDRATAWGPVPGWTDAYDWRGEVPFDELPAISDPPDGFLVTANQEIVGRDYPHYLGYDYSRPDRARRITERVAALEDATVDDMAAIHRDRRSRRADVWVDALARLEGRDDTERTALDVLRRWDRMMEPESVGAAVYLVTRDRVGVIVARHPALAPLRAPFPGEPPGGYAPLELRLWNIVSELLGRGDTTLLPDGQSWNDVLADGLTDAVTLLRAELGDRVEGWRWGALHRCAPWHPLAAVHRDWAGRLNPPPVEMGGEWDTVWAAAHPAGYGFGVTTASVARYAFDLADWDRSGWVVPLGADGDAARPHFADQQRAWADGVLLPMRYGWDGIRAAAESETTLRPA